MTDQPDRARWKWSFSTMGCADLSFPEICELADEFNIRGIELRGVAGRLDLAQYFSEVDLTPARLQTFCARCKVRLVVAGSSFKLVGSNEAEFVTLLEFCDWADSVGIPFVRVFGGGQWGQPLTEADLDGAAALINRWRGERKRRHWKVDVALETHDAFSASQPCLELIGRLDEPLALVWDSHHTWRLGDEPPADTWSQLGDFVRHVHVKDSIAVPSARHPFTYVLPAAGQMPLTDVINVLRQAGFSGWVSLEWERLWHPYLPPLRDALAALRQQPWFEPHADERPSETLAT